MGVETPQLTLYAILFLGHRDVVNDGQNSVIFGAIGPKTGSLEVVGVMF